MTRLLFFGALQDAAGARERLVDLPEQVRTVADLRDWLGAREPLLAARLAAQGVRCAVDLAFARDDTGVSSAKEIAFMSPLSGG